MEDIIMDDLTCLIKNKCDYKNDVSLSQPDIDGKVLFDSLPSTQESNFRSDGSLSCSGEYVCQKLEEFGLPEAAKKFRGKKPNLINGTSSTFLFLMLMLE
jgi:hypothetical protein